MAQTIHFEKKLCIEVTGTRIVTDNFGNIYVIDKSSVKKFDKEGKALSSYTEYGDGKISGLDVSDPLKIILFNADFGKIKFLDNKLTLKNNSISLFDLGYANASLIAASYESGFWLFDPLSNQVVRFDNSLQPSQSSGNINDLIGHDFAPNFLMESDNILYVNDPRYGIFIFDRYATYLKMIPIKNLKSFQVINNKIVYLDDNFIKTLDLKTYDETTFKLPQIEDELLNATVDNQRLYVITKKKLCIYMFL